MLLAVLVLGLGVCLVTGARAASLINGAGSTFAYPLYSKWAYEYNKLTGLRLNYQSIGSGGGIKQIMARTVDFGASDAPLSVKDLDKSGLIQFPMAVGGVVPVVNVEGVAPGQMRLTGEVLAEIYLGDITRWNDKRIAALNQGMRLPDEAITVIHRADGSGTSWIFTNYLSKVSRRWADKVGFGTAVSWPVGVGGKGNEGVAAYIKRIKNSIGYVELAYVMQNRLAYTQLENRDKAFVKPTIESSMAAAGGADWKHTPGYAVVLTDQPGKEAWPIAGATFILMHRKQTNCSTAGSVFKFFDWAYRNGSGMAKSLDYVPIPEKVYGVMEDSWAKEVRCDGRVVWK